MSQLEPLYNISVYLCGKSRCSFEHTCMCVCTDKLACVCTDYVRYWRIQHKHLLRAPERKDELETWWEGEPVRHTQSTD